jgi:hypothetical protein
MGKKYYIFNKPYSKSDYENLKAKITKYMKETGEWGQFFPGYFAPNPYDESLSGYHFPLSLEEQRKRGFRAAPSLEHKQRSYLPVSEIPDSMSEITDEIALTQKVFWDEDFHRPFQISHEDIQFSKKLGVPLPHSYYMNRIQKNFSWMPFDGELRTTKCAKSGKEIQTSWPEIYDERILCEEAYLKVIH